MMKEFKSTGSVETNDRLNILAFNQIYITIALFWLLGIVQGPLVKASAIDSLSTIHPQGRVWVTDGTVHAIHQQGGVLYLGGEFQKVGPNPGGVSALKISSAETDADFPLIEGKIFAIASDGEGNLYLGGNFDRVGVFARSNLVKLNPDYSVAQAWRPSITGPVTALEVSDDRLFIGGNFRGSVSKLSVTEAVRSNVDVTAISDISATRIDSSEVLGNTSLQVKVPAGSYLTVVDLNSGRKDLTWNPEINGQVTALKVVGDLLFAGGEFVVAGGVRQSYFAAFSKETARLVENRFRLELNRPVRAIHQRGNLLYIGGEFTQVGKQPFPYLFAGNLTTGELVTDWMPAPNLPVTSLDSNASNLFVGGRFTEIAGSQKPFAAAFSLDDGSLVKGWEPFPDAPVLDLKVLSNRLYLGGDFTNIGGVSVAFVAAMSIKNGRILPDWSPTALTPVSRLFIHSVSSQIENEDTGADADGIRLDDDTGVTARPVLDTIAVKVRLIATGGFVGADWMMQSNVSAINTSKGDIASAWENPTVNGPVYSLEFTGQSLALGGDFNRVNGEKQENFVRFQLKTGEPILNPAESVPWPVFDIKIIDRKLYVAGGRLSREEEALGGVMVASLSRDSGFQDFVVTQEPVFAIDSYEDRLVLGGRFVSINQERQFGLALVDLSTGDLIPDFAPKLKGEVRDFLILEQSLFIVGEFQHVNGLRRNNVAAFNIESGRLLDWSPRVNGRVNSV
ncbi:MAG TPA: hypothetical protein EYG38_03060, partial [Verrucomicrobia bacterium]|nr:hypothetical protein [Verrucomicrobiota bacterium]